MKLILLIAVFILLAGNALLLLFIFKVRRIRELTGKYIYAVQPYLLFFTGTAGIAAAVYFSIFHYRNVMPVTASEHGRTVDKLFYITLAFTGCIFLLTQFLLFFFPFRYRAGDKPAYHIKGNAKVEFFWMLIPFLAFTFLFLWGQVLWGKIQNAGNDRPLEIEVMAEQFNWRVRYPGKDGKLGMAHYQLIDPVNDFGLDFRDGRNHDDFTPVQLHIPKNRPVKILLRSRDVIHSFYIPHMKVKMDAVPGITTQITFKATHSTEDMRVVYNNPAFNYEVACAELCGRMHFSMLLILVVDEPEDFRKWYNANTPWLSSHPEYLQKTALKQ